MSIKVSKTKKPKRTDLTGLVNAELARNREDFKHEEGKKIEQTYIYCSKLCFTENSIYFCP